MDEVALRRLEESTRDATRLQHETLRSILRTNAGVPYLRRYIPCDDDGQSTIVDEFKKRVPVSSYDEDYAPIIRKMADDGDSSFLSFDPLVCFFYSSGTSSLRPKMVPFFDSVPGKTASHSAHQASQAIIRRFAPPTRKVNKILWFLYAGSVRETKSGLRALAATTFPMHAKGPNSSQLFDLCISPPEVVLGLDCQQQMYCHLLCGLRRFDAIDGIRAPYAIGLVRAFQLLESKWEQVCEDIESGSVTSEITDSSMRNSVEEFLGGPRPDIANRVREVCRMQGGWKGILCELWPELRYIACVTTGSMEQYYPLLKHYTGEKIPVLAGDYFASECAVGINMNKLLPPHQTRYTILPTTAYFEFLPFSVDSVGHAEPESLLGISNVEVGKVYEVVVTTYRGFYRYRLGDVVRVAGFHNLSPQVEFVTRAPKDADEVFTERDLMTAMGSAFQFMLADEMKGEVVEYTSFVDSETYPKHLVIFVEVNKWTTPPQHERHEIHFLKKCCPAVEDCLGSVYKVQRENGGLGHLEICIVKTGSFDELMRMSLGKGAPANQYKLPKILRDQELAGFLKSSIVFTTR